MGNNEISENIAKGFSSAAGTIDTSGTDAVIDMAMEVFGIDESERKKLEILFAAYAVENVKQNIMSAIRR